MSTSIRRSAWAITFALAAAACGGGSDSSPSSEPARSDIVASDEGTEIEPDATPVATDAAAPPASDDGSANAVVEEVVEEELEPVAGGTLRMALEADAGGLNPTSSALTASGLNMANAAFDTLAAIGADGAAVPYLAESIEPVDGDLTLWRMRLRPGIVLSRRHSARCSSGEDQLRHPVRQPAGEHGDPAVLPDGRRHHRRRRPDGGLSGARTEFDVPQSIDRPARHDGLAGMVGRCGRGRDPESGAGRDGTVCHRLA